MGKKRESGLTAGRIVVYLRDERLQSTHEGRYTIQQEMAKNYPPWRGWGNAEKETMRVDG